MVAVEPVGFDPDDVLDRLVELRGECVHRVLASITEFEREIDVDNFRGLQPVARWDAVAPLLARLPTFDEVEEDPKGLNCVRLRFQWPGTLAVVTAVPRGEDSMDIGAIHCAWTCTAAVDGSWSCSNPSGTGSGQDAECYTNDGLYCSSAGVCAPQGDVGARCTTAETCASGLWCSSTMACTPQVARGGACSSNDACEEGLYCKGGSCVEELPAGASCEVFVDECLGGSCDNGVCVASSIGGGMSASTMCGLAGAH